MLYAAAGITRAHEGITHAADLALMQRAAAAGANIIDVVANRNPLKVDPMEFKDIKVVETVKEGRTIYPAR